MPCGRLVGVVRQAVSELLADMALVAQEDLVIVGHAVERASLVIQLDIVEPDPVPLRIGVGIAHRIGLISRVAKALGERRQMRLHRTARLKGAVAVLARGAPRHKGTPCGQANGRLGVAIGEPHPVPTQLIEHRRVDGGMTCCPKQGGWPVISDYQKDIGLQLSHFFLPIFAIR